MKKLAELLGQRLCDGDVGVEIECEGDGIKISDNLFWRTERDGSLRGEYPYGAAEFVMAQPVNIEHVEMALDTLIEEQKDAEFNFSFRTSVHVHVNVQQMTEPEMLAFLYLCLLVEEPLMNFCGETRKANRFCLRYADAEGFDKTLDNMFDKGYQAIGRLDGEKIRYAAINVHALQKYGSIEFRGMRGNMDKAIILPWCQTLVHLRNYAKELGSPVNVFNKYISMDNAAFITESLGPHADKFFYEGQNKDVERSFSLTIDLPHIFKGRKEVVEQVFIPMAAPKRRGAAPAPAVRKIPVEADMAVMEEAKSMYGEWLNDEDEENDEHSEEFKRDMFIEFFKDAKRVVDRGNERREAQKVEQAAIIKQQLQQAELIAQLAAWDAARKPQRVVVNNAALFQKREDLE